MCFAAYLPSKAKLTPHASLGQSLYLALHLKPSLLPPNLHCAPSLSGPHSYALLLPNLKAHSDVPHVLQKEADTLLHSVISVLSFPARLLNAFILVSPPFIIHPSIVYPYPLTIPLNLCHQRYKSREYFLVLTWPGNSLASDTDHSF